VTLQSAPPVVNVVLALCLVSASVNQDGKEHYAIHLYAQTAVMHFTAAALPQARVCARQDTLALSAQHPFVELAAKARAQFLVHAIVRRATRVYCVMFPFVQVV